MAIELEKYLIKKSKSSYVYDSIIRPFWRLYVHNSIRNIDKISKRCNPPVYLIQRDKSVGFCSYISTSLGHIWIALKENRLPVIDLQTYKNGYIEDDEIGKVNSWEYYFKQPYEQWNLNTISDCDVHNHVEEKIDFSNFEYHNKKYDLWDILYKRYIVFNDDMKEHIDKAYDNVLDGGKDRILGVKLRGTDYVRTRPEGHPVQPETSDVIAHIKELEGKNRFDRMFVVADELQIVEQFEEAFPGKVIRAREQYYDDNYVIGTNIINTSLNRENDKYLQGKEYLIELALLSKCDSLVGSLCGGTNFAYYMNHRKYKFVHIFNLGTY